MKRIAVTFSALAVSMLLAGAALPLYAAEGSEGASDATVNCPRRNTNMGSGMGPGIMGHEGMMGGMEHGMMGGMGRHNSQMHMEHMCSDHEAHQAAMLAYAETKLKLTDAQKPLWAKFVETAKASNAPLAKLCAEQKDKQQVTTLPERLEQKEKAETAHLEHLKIIRPALTAMYDALSPEQKKTVDSFMDHQRSGMMNRGK
ncbi:periplasmic protein CpxP/Spy [Azospirillaceae bacterium]